MSVTPEAAVGSPVPSTPAPKPSGLANAALVLGIVSLLAWLIPIIGLAVSICGIVFSAKTKRGGCLAMNIIGLVLSVLNAIIGAAIMS